jgi:PTS system mannose-specific IIA component
MTEGTKKTGCLVVAHGTLADALLEAVQGILGKQSGCRAISNAGLGLKSLTENVNKAVSELAEDFNVVVFVDMPGGSCHHVCQELVKVRGDVKVVTGVNLMMLLEFFVRRDRHDIIELVGLLKEKGCRAIRSI